MVKSPFKFLDYYKKEDREIFFGREAETLELYDRIYETNLVLLYGASGTGKTSLINCGLSNEFEATDWLPVFVRRQGNFIDSLSAAIEKESITKKPKDATLKDRLRSLYLDYFKPVYLIFDQFEEIFILGDKSEQKWFFELLDVMLKIENVKVILSMREEYLAFLSEYEAVTPNIMDNRLRVEKMNSKNLYQVITGTAEHFEIQMEDKSQVTDKIIERLRDKNHEVDLATLQVFMDRMYRLDVERRGHVGKDVCFDTELVEKMGSLEDVLALFLDEQLAVLERELERDGYTQKNMPLDILFSLVTDTGTKQPMEIAVIKRQLAISKQIPDKVVDYCVERFREMRIIRDLG